MSEPPAAVSDAMYYTEAADLAAVRAFVRSHALAFGLLPARTDLLLLAVTELATNTLQHTTGGGRIRVWAEPDQIVCDVLDQGPLRGSAPVMPPANALGGRGLAIVERICDEVTVTADRDGTLVRLRLRF